MLYAPVKSLGQNFLLAPEVAELMVNSLELRGTETVVEIGAGLGVITKILADRLISPASKVFAIEIDDRFTAKLNEMFLEQTNVRIVHEDILTWLPKFEPSKNLKIIGSLPYYITSPIIHQVLALQPQPQACVFLIQKEVAQKICAQVPKATYMSSIVQTFYSAHYLADVPRKLFDPQPSVDGAIIKLHLTQSSGDLQLNMKAYEAFLHHGFSHPRKMLNKVFTNQQLSRFNLSGNLRPQNISSDMWLEMYNGLKKNNLKKEKGSPLV